MNGVGMTSSNQSAAGAGTAEMLSLFAMLCGFFMLLAAAYFYVDVYRAARVAVLPVFGDIARAFSPSGMTEDDRAEMDDIAEEHARLQEELREAHLANDRAAAHAVRQDIDDLATRERELLDDIRARRDSDDADQSSEASAALQNLSDEMKAKVEIGRLLGMIGAPLFLLGGLIYGGLRSARKA